MTRQIDSDAVINAVRYAEQGSDPSTPAAGYYKDYFKAGGLYWVDDNGVVAGPIGSNFVPSGRLTLTTATPVTTADVTGAATLYYTPYTGNMISLYDGARWIPVIYTEKSLSIAAFTASKPYDIFGYLSSGTLALEGLVWTDATTRATALAYQDGRLVKSGAATRLYLGSIYVNSSGGQTDDSVTKRNVFNYYNRVQRQLYLTEATSHTYTTGSYRSWNNDATVRFQITVGVAENIVHLYCAHQGSATADTINKFVGLGYDATNAVVNDAAAAGVAISQLLRVSTSFDHMPGIGNHYYQVVELGGTTATFAVCWAGGYILA